MLAQRDGGADLQGEDKAAVVFHIRPAKGGWSVRIEVAATLMEMRRLWGKPSSVSKQSASPR
jgi:hypothetical protein